MPSLTAEEVARRRTRVAYLLLTNVPRSEIPERLGLTRRTVGRDIAAIRKSVDGAAGTNREALDETIDALNTAGRLETVDNAKVATLRAMATQLDDDTTNSQMFRVYWDSLEALTADADDDGPVGQLLAELFSNMGDQATPGT